MSALGNFEGAYGPRRYFTAVAILLTNRLADDRSLDDWTGKRHGQPHQAWALQRSLVWEI